MRALEEIHGLLRTECCKTHQRMNIYGRIEASSSACTDEGIALNAKKSEVLERISKEIEEYAIQKYKKYNLIIVPVCHRNGSTNGDRLNIELKVKEFPEAKAEIEALRIADENFKRDLEAVDAWHFEALKAVALKEELPTVPTFTKS